MTEENKQQNFDDIPITPSNGDFLALLEKNLENEKNNPDAYKASDKPVRKFTPTKVVKKEIKISKPSKDEIKKYKYYSDNFEEKTKKDLEEEKKEKLKQSKEKAKEIDHKYSLKNNKKEPPEEKPIEKYSFII